MNDLADLFSPTHPAAWALASTLIAIIAANLTWLIARRRAAHSAFTAAGGWLIVSLFYLLPPLAAWRIGVLSPFFAGITEQDWIGSLAQGLSLVAVLLGAMFFGWLVYRRTLPHEGGIPARHERIVTALRAPLDAALLQWHWAFYRALVIGWLAAITDLPAAPPWLATVIGSLVAQPVYWGAWLGLGLAGLEWLLNPFARAALRMPGSREAALRQVALAFATTALFTITRSFWLCLACHVALEIVLTGWFPLPRISRDEAP